jgi:hypothetical protein
MKELSWLAKHYENAYILIKCDSFQQKDNKQQTMYALSWEVCFTQVICILSADYVYWLSLNVLLLLCL